jgi:hypothetical protein
VQSVVAGLSAGYAIAVTSLNNFSGTVTYSCGNLPALATCTITPTQSSVTPTTQGTAEVRITTTAAGRVVWQGGRRLPPELFNFRGLPALSALMLAMMLWAGRRRLARRQVWLGRMAAVLLVLVLGIFAAGCQQNIGTPGTPAGTYVISIQATSGAISNSSSVTLIVR